MSPSFFLWASFMGGCRPPYSTLAFVIPGGGDSHLALVLPSLDVSDRHAAHNLQVEPMRPVHGPAPAPAPAPAQHPNHHHNLRRRFRNGAKPILKRFHTITTRFQYDCKMVPTRSQTMIPNYGSDAISKRSQKRPDSKIVPAIGWSSDSPLTTSLRPPPPPPTAAGPFMLVVVRPPARGVLAASRPPDRMLAVVRLQELRLCRYSQLMTDMYFA